MGLYLGSSEKLKFNLNNVKCFAKVFFAKQLPKSYVRLDYIESTGTQYIDTGFQPNQSTEVICKAQYTGVGGTGVLFGYRYSNSANRYEFFVTSGSFYSAYGASAARIGTATTDLLTIDKAANLTFVNGEEAVEHSPVTFQCAGSLFLFCVNRNGTPTLHCKARMYSSKVYDGGVLVRDFVPCISPDGEIGMYDLVNGVFYGNAGTDTFVPSHTIIDYIESNGTQYINTNFIPNNNSKVVMDCQSVGVGTMSSAQAFFGARTGTTSNCFAVYWHKGDSSYRYYYGTSYGSKKLDRITDRITITAEKNVATFGDAVTLTRPIETFDGSYPIYLFAMCNAGEVMGATRLRVYSCKIYDRGVLVRDYVPCINDDGEYGLWDKANRVFYGNSGTGSFIGYGAESTILSTEDAGTPDDGSASESI